MNQSQRAALKKLESALLACKRADVVLVGCEDGMLAAPDSEALRAAIVTTDSTHAVINDLDCYNVKTYGALYDCGSP